jgi:hypothetical protein
MLIRSSLFSRERGNNPDLYEVLEHRKRAFLQSIDGIASLDQMTDAFLNRMVRESLVTPVALHLDQTTRKTRTEHFRGEEFPDRFMFNVYEGSSYPKTVTRLSIPFSGDPGLLRHCPSSHTFNPPFGEVNGNLIQFDLVLWGYSDDAKRVADEFTRNRDALVLYTNNANSQVKAFNEQLPGVVTSAFNAKLDRLTAQHSFLDALGIKEEAPPLSPIYAPSGASTKPKKETSRRTHIIQHIQQTYVQYIQQMNVNTLNQTNNNTGDVNNEIQSD